VAKYFFGCGTPCDILRCLGHVPFFLAPRMAGSHGDLIPSILVAPGRPALSLTVQPWGLPTWEPEAAMALFWSSSVWLGTGAFQGPPGSPDSSREGTSVPAFPGRPPWCVPSPNIWEVNAASIHCVITEWILKCLPERGVLCLLSNQAFTWSPGAHK
jgi:hypothetical protein